MARRDPENALIEAKPPASRAGLLACTQEAAHRVARAQGRRGQGAGEWYQSTRRSMMALAVELLAAERGVAVGLPGFRGLGRERQMCAGAVHRALQMARTVAPGGPAAALGAVYESLLALHPSIGRGGHLHLTSGSMHDRKTTGAYFTPAPVVEHLLDMALDPLLAAVRGRVWDLRVCDPACGCGNFLVAAARRIARAGGGRQAMRRAVDNCIFGVDNDPLAVDICRAALRIEAAGTEPGDVDLAIRCADALTADWDRLFPSVIQARGGFDAIVGNPPYLNQLSRETTTGRGTAALLKNRFPGSVGAYTDPAALFLLVATEITRPGGRVALVLPQSVLATRDAAGVRAGVLARGRIESLWMAREKVFDAGVMVCAPTIRIGRRTPVRVSRYLGTGFKPIEAMKPDPNGSWAALAAVGVPDVALKSAGTLGDIATATADFRDQYYGLRGCVVEDAELNSPARRRMAPLITTGLIDAACCRWGTRATRFDRQIWQAPRVNLGLLARQTDLGPWARTRLVPKVLLATQTRTLEAVVDETGQWLPAVPVITIVPRRKEDLWRIAAVLLSPVATAWAIRHHGSAGLSSTAIKLSAKQTLEMPVPAPGPAWNQAAALIAGAMKTRDDEDRAARLQKAGRAMCAACGIQVKPAAHLLAWWDRLLHPHRQAPVSAVQRAGIRSPDTRDSGRLVRPSGDAP